MNFNFSLNYNFNFNPNIGKEILGGPSTILILEVTNMRKKSLIFILLTLMENNYAILPK